MKVIYVAGPYRSQTEYGIVSNIREAEAVGIQVWQAGYVALTPHLNTRLFGGLCPDGTWLRGGLELMRRCDGVILTSRWITSPGTLCEIAEALRLGLPVFTTITEMIEVLG